jgi:phytoene dehydrogenase-like protein
MKKTIAIIGAGMGGMAAGIYGQRNGFETRIFEAHSVPGGQCVSWKRKGYTFDACIHHLFVCDPRFPLYGLWEELGAMPRELAPTVDCVSVENADGRMLWDYYEPARLRDHLMSLAPGDREAIDFYLRGIELAMSKDVWGSLLLGGWPGMVGSVPAFVRLRRYLKLNLNEFALRFQDPLLRRAFPLVEYNFPDMPLLIHLVKHAYGAQGGIKWPIGGSAGFARSIERKYRELGGEVHYGKRVAKILTANGRATGVKLEDGEEVSADYVISNADGRKTILEMLEGRYLNDKIRGYCAEPDDLTNWAVHVFLGVNRDLSREPSALVMLLDHPVEIAGHSCASLEMQIYGADPTMAPPGKGVIKVELYSTHSYWKKLAEDRARYNEEKERVAETVIGLVERHFPGIRGQVEAIDVPTLLTWERYMGGTHGFANMPKKQFSIIASVLGRGTEFTLPGLERFYFAGAWATSAGALFMNALSGRKVMHLIAAKEGQRFTAT